MSPGYSAQIHISFKTNTLKKENKLCFNWVYCFLDYLWCIDYKIRHGWIYHNLYPVYPVLGTPDEQWNRSIEKFGLVKNWVLLI